MAIDHVFAGIPTADFGSALPWYERLIGRRPDVVVKADEVMWQLTDSAWIYVVADVERAGRALITILVDDLESHLAGLAERGFPGVASQTVPGLFSKAEIIDPDGNKITFGEDLSAEE